MSGHESDFERLNDETNLPITSPPNALLPTEEVIEALAGARELLAATPIGDLGSGIRPSLSYEDKRQRAIKSGRAIDTAMRALAKPDEGVVVALRSVDPFSADSATDAFYNLLDLSDLVNRGIRPRLDGRFLDSVSSVGAALKRLANERNDNA